jgi:tetratricopeptide (TPR) repeat protein
MPSGDRVLPLVKSLALVGLVLAGGTSRAFSIQPQSRSSPQAWATLVDQYRTGNAAEAVRELLSWPKERVEKEAATVADRSRLAAESHLGQFRAAIGLHGEAAVRSTSLSGFRMHDQVVSSLFATLIEQSWPTLNADERSRVRWFYVNWVVMGSGYLSTAGQPLLAVRRVEEARANLAQWQSVPIPATAAPAQPASATGDADILLALGSAREMAAMMIGSLLATTAARSAGDASPDAVLVRQMVTARTEELTGVAELYRQALALEPSLVEGRVRLGRVLCLAGEVRGAIDELERARRDAGQGYLFYLATLFLGHAYEQSGERGKAVDCYRSAIGEYPEAQAAYLALARLAESGGLEDAPPKVLAQMFGSEPATRPERDPWWMYPYGQAWQFQARIDALRAMVRQ